jgi:hypothetical protein
MTAGSRWQGAGTLAGRVVSQGSGWRRESSRLQACGLGQLLVALHCLLLLVWCVGTHTTDDLFRAGRGLSDGCKRAGVVCCVVSLDLSCCTCLKLLLLLLVVYLCVCVCVCACGRCSMCAASKILRLPACHE